MKKFIKFSVLSVFASILSPTSFAACNHLGQGYQYDIDDIRYVINSDGTVSDKQTGLMWKQCLEGISGSLCEIGVASKLNWSEALKAGNDANNQSFAGFSDWRLANVKELYSIVETACRPSIHESAFPSHPSVSLWSSTPYGGGSFKSWMVHFDNAGTGNVGRTQLAAARLVRTER